VETATQAPPTCSTTSPIMPTVATALRRVELVVPPPGDGVERGRPVIIRTIHTNSANPTKIGARDGRSDCSWRATGGAGIRVVSSLGALGAPKGLRGLLAARSSPKIALVQQSCTRAKCLPQTISYGQRAVKVILSMNGVRTASRRAG